MFYNGKEDQPLESELKLSDTYIAKCDKISLEAVVKVINVNYEKGARILKKCQTLREEDGYMRGLEEGEANGEAKGKFKEKHDIAVKMLKKGMDIKLIEEITGLPEAEIYDLQKK